MVVLLVFTIASLEIVFAEINCWRQKVHFEITFSKIRLKIH